MKRAFLVALLALASPACADHCHELAEQAKVLEAEVASLQRDIVAGDARLVDLEGALAAAFAERRTMKQATRAADWAASAYRLVIELHLAASTCADRHLTLERGDPNVPVELAVQAALADGVTAVDRADAGRVAAYGARIAAKARLTPKLAAAVVDTLRAALEVAREAQASRLLTESVPSAPPAEKLTRRYDQPDLAIDTLPELAPHQSELRAKAAALDAALAAAALAAEKEPHPAETMKPLLDAKSIELAAARKDLAQCPDAH